MKRHTMHPYMNAARQQMQQQEAELDPDYAEPEDHVELNSTEEAPGGEVPQEVPENEDAQDKKALEEERLRMAAEMENFKKRLTREHQEQMRYASEKVLNDLLPALDNLDLALQYGSQHEACKDMMLGIEMTRKQLLDAVGKSGLVSVGEKGEQFNPEIHEAIGVESSPDVEKGAVSRIMQRGYKLHDRLLRPAKVMVNN